MIPYKKVAVLLGGSSAEREVSLMSGKGVLEALRRQGVEALAFDPAERPLEELRTEGVDACFIALHGRYGEDGLIQAALELLGIPYTGSGVLASALSMDKPLTKRVWASAGLPTPGFVEVAPGEAVDSKRLVEQLGLPMVVKPAREGSSIGLTRVTDVSQIPQAIERGRVGQDAVLAEQMVSGREFTIAILQSQAGEAPQALPIIEIRAPEGDYDYHNKYLADDVQYLCPAPLPAEVAEAMQRNALEAFRLSGCEGWARVDVLWDGESVGQMLEINTSPGMTTHSLVPMAARAVGMDYDALVMALLRSARLKVGPMWQVGATP